MRPADIKSKPEKIRKEKGVLLGSETVTATSGRIFFFLNIKIYLT